MPGTARCISCFREESREGTEVVAVLQAGGGRRPAVPAELAAWRTLRRVHAGELPSPVAVCAACGQPMFVHQGELPPLEKWEFTLPDSVIVVGPDGAVMGGNTEEADQRIEAHYQPALEDKNSASAVGFAVILLGAAGIVAAFCGALECPTMATMAAATTIASTQRKK